MTDQNEDIAEHDKSSKKNQVKNRRFAYMNQYLRGTSYFSQEAIKERHPLLYEQFYGADAQKPFEQEEKLSERLYKNMEMDIISERKKSQMRNAGLAVDDSDSDSEEDDNDEGIGFEADLDDIKNDPFIGYSAAQLALFSEEDRQEILMRHSRMYGTAQERKNRELVKITEQKYLAGEDYEFVNYKDIDNNEMYDDLEQLERDEQEIYFTGDNIESDDD